MGGRSRINHIVSFNKTSFPIHFSISVNKNIFHTLVQSVAKSLFSASTHFLVNMFSNDDFHAFVYHTIHIIGSHFLILLCLCRFLICSNSFNFSFILICLSFRCLFILSVLVSHNHLIAPPPPPLLHHCLLSSIPIPKILGHICLIAANSICNLASMLSACFSNIFSIKSILSRAFIGVFNHVFSLAWRNCSFIP